MTKFPYIDDLSMLPKTYVSVDIEGSGVFGSGNGIVELAIIPVIEGKISEPNIWLFKHYISPEGTKIHGITNEDVSDKLPISSHVMEIQNAVTNMPYVGHHVGLDISLIKKSIPGWVAPQIFDTYRISKKIFPKKYSNYKLKNLIREFNIVDCIRSDAERIFEKYPRQLSGFHTAGYDALACIHLIEYMRLVLSKDKSISGDKQFSLF